MNKIKIIEFITTLSMGGAEQLVKEYSLLLNKEKFDVIVLAIWRRENSQNEKQLLDAGIRIVYISDYLPKGNDLFSRIRRKQKRKQFVFNFMKKEKPNIIHGHLAVLEYIKGLPLKKWKIKVVYTCHNVLSDTFNKTEYVKYAKKLIQKADMKMIALHPDMASEINELFGIDDCFVVNNGIDFREFKPDPLARNVTRKMLGISDNDYVIGHVGRFTEQKNQKFLVNLFENIVKEKENAHLLMIGDGADRKEIEAYIKEHGLEKYVTILSNRADVANLMNAMDMFVFPSVFEGFGIVLVEAQAVGLKCVVSTAISKYACLTPQVNILSLEDSIEKWKNRVLNLEWEKTDFCGIEEFDIRKVVLKLEDIYFDLLKNK